MLANRIGEGKCSLGVFFQSCRTSLSVLSFDMRIDVDHIVTIALFMSVVAAFAYLTYQIIELL